ncbi:MAG: DUF4097 family beta strand repeat protein [Chloroflexi bacterium]|nr:DUF4097 family beta strand repeat protein [Chloroflexota bacterium]
MGSRHELPKGARLRVLTISGRVNVIAEERNDLEVDPPDKRVKLDGDHVAELKSRSSNLTIRCPIGTNVSIGTVSGHVKLEGSLGSIKISTISSGVELDTSSGDIDIRTISGSINVARCGGSCKLGSKSGSIRVGGVGGDVRASTISGSLDVETLGRGEVSLKAVSGSMRVRIPHGKRPRVRMKTLSGSVKCDCEQGSDFEIKGGSISGSLHVTES